MLFRRFFVLAENRQQRATSFVASLRKLVLAGQFSLLLLFAGCSRNSTPVSSATKSDPSLTKSGTGQPAERTRSSIVRTAKADSQPAALNVESQTTDRKSAMAEKESTATGPDVLKKIDSLRAQSRQAADQHDFGKAFRLSSEAWALAGTDPGDSQRRQARKELSAEVEKWAKQSNEKFRAETNDPETLLIEK